MYAKTQEREKFFDIAKGVCILFVTCTHLNWFGLNKVLLFPYWIGMAVPAFMIISGYLYTKSAERANIYTMAQAYDPRRIGKELLRFAVPFTLMFLLDQTLEFVYAGGVLSPPRITLLCILMEAQGREITTMHLCWSLFLFSP